LFAPGADELANSGLVIKSSAGDLTLQNPPTVIAENLHDSFDLILLSGNAYDLDGAIASFAPAVGQACKLGSVSPCSRAHAMAMSYPASA
jgi:ketopantoate reductase